MVEPLKQMLDSEAYALLASNMHEMVCLHAPDGTYQWVSPSVKNLLGYEPEDLIGTDPYLLFHEDDVRPIQKLHMKSAIEQANGGKELEIDYRIRRRDGNYIWIASLTKGIYNDKGELTQILTTSRDISTRREAEQQLADSEARWRSLIEFADDRIFMLNREGQILFINYMGQGYGDKELEGKNFFDAFINKEQHGFVKQGIEQVFKLPSPFGFENWHTGKDGSHLCYSCIVTPVRKVGTTDSVLVIARDITARIKMRESMVSAALQAQENERQRIARELHDGMGQLLSGIKMSIMTFERELNEQGYSDTEMHLQQMREMIKRALNETRTLSHNLMPDVLKRFGLGEAIEEFCESIAKNANFNLVYEFVDVPSGLSQHFQLNVYRITQELLTNVIRHSEAKKVVLQLIGHTNSLILQVEDDGKGFDPKSQSRGLGLKNLFSRTELLGGVVDISSSEGKGTLIIIELPLKKTPNDTDKSTSS